MIGASKCDIDLNSLFHTSATAPQAQPNQPVLASKVEPVSSIAPADALGDLNLQFVPYRSSRHDEFDWALTKV